MKSQYQKFDTLVSKLLDGSASTSEFAELNVMLVSSTDLQHRYCSFIRNESIFHWENESTVSNDEPKIINFPVFSYVASIAAVLVCLASAWFLHSNYFQKSFHANKLTEANQIPQTVSNEMDFKSSQSSQIVDRKFSKPMPLENLNEKAERLLHFFESKQDITDEGELSFDGTLPFLKVDELLSTAGKSGILPMSDGKMIELSDMLVDTVNQVAEVTETLRVYDMSSADLSTQSSVDASIHFNQSQSNLSDSTEFSLSLLAIETAENGFHEISSTEQMIYGDNDQTTWEKVDTGFAIPDGTEYLVVSLKAKKHGPSALTANKHDFFADELEISFVGI